METSAKNIVLNQQNKRDFVVQVIERSDHNYNKGIERSMLCQNELFFIRQ